MVHITQGMREKIEGRFEMDVRWLLNHAFVHNEFFTLSECAKYKPSMDENIWRQNRGEREEYVEIYHKGEWLCDVHSKMGRDQMIEKVARHLGNKLERERLLKLQKEEGGGEK